MDQSAANQAAVAAVNQILSHVDVTSVAKAALASPAAYTGMVFWVAIATIVVASIYFRQKGRSERNKLLQTLAEKGQPIPPELLRDKQPTPKNYIARGIVLVSVGIAMILFLAAAVGAFAGTMGRNDIVVPFLGLFPLSLGLAYLGIGLYQRRHG